MHAQQTLKIFVILFAVFTIGTLFGMFLQDIGYVPSFHTADVSQSFEKQEEISVDLTIDYGNGDAQTFSAQKLSQGNSVFDLLMRLEEEKGIVIDVRNFPGLGKFVEAIHGVHSTNNFYWQYWVNDEYATVGAELYELKDGDQILWKRTNEI